ncbi:MAG: hypothetical protein H6797_00600 [Candidatus Nomurabacteria bacterium]|nr:MAG: hypothetical protein H6797_00600 [Candidatus Nomurabacteria bacterium]
MNEPTVSTDEVAPKAWYRQELVVFIFGSLIIAGVLVMLGLGLYVSSGSNLLDASRPGFKSVRNEIDQFDSFQTFPSSGSVSRDTIDQFLKLYDKQVQPVTDNDVYNANTLDDQVLGIDEPSAGE